MSRWHPEENCVDSDCPNHGTKPPGSDAEAWVDEWAPAPTDEQVEYLTKWANDKDLLQQGAEALRRVDWRLDETGKAEWYAKVAQAPVLARLREVEANCARYHVDEQIHDERIRGVEAEKDTLRENAADLVLTLQAERDRLRQLIQDAEDGMQRFFRRLPGRRRYLNRGIDTCIAPLVKALNDVGMATVASCCGHGHLPGNIILEDGREIIIVPDYETGRKVDALFPVTCYGEPVQRPGGTS